MSHKTKFLPAAFLAGVLAGGATALLLTPHSEKSTHTSVSRDRSTDSYDLGNLDCHGAACLSVRSLPPAPMGWY